MVKTYLFDRAKFDDLSTRSMLLQQNQEMHTSDLSYSPGADSQIQLLRQNIWNEYSRRIYQGYSTSSDGHASPEVSGSALTFTKQMFASYNSFEISNNVEARINYNVTTNSMQCSVVSPVINGEFSRTTFSNVSIVHPHEYYTNISDALNDLTYRPPMSISFSRDIASIGASAKVRYGIASPNMDYGISKTLVGPISGQIVHEERLPGANDPIHRNLIFQISAGSVF
jgi:hypothetical protein